MKGIVIFSIVKLKIKLKAKEISNKYLFFIGVFLFRKMVTIKLNSSVATTTNILKTEFKLKSKPAKTLNILSHIKFLARYNIVIKQKRHSVKIKTISNVLGFFVFFKYIALEIKNKKKTNIASPFLKYVLMLL